jgi:hypothetical protein
MKRESFPRGAWIVAVGMLVTIHSLAQDRRHAVGLDLGGPGWLYAVTYEYQTPSRMIARAGVGFIPQFYAFHVGVGKLFGKTKSYFELAGGLNGYEWRASNSYERHDNSAFAYVHLGYRYQRHGRRMLYRVGLDPMFRVYSKERHVDEPEFLLGAGLGFGYRF